ncbi:carnosine N-methyltransferase [Skeletonema marinoi]|uniref:carnosine N-methyltransferase n=1 Tax=Skeletonema marinoi TaxID=267567 RepID=A0AAD9D699_9STRA|nr:carnosine N-methyltransferase [Skeletonema marinoi]
MTISSLLSSYSSSVPLRPSTSSCPIFATAFQIQASVSVPQQQLSTNRLQNHEADKIETLVKEKLNRIATGYQIHGEKMKRTLEMELELSGKVEKCFMGDNADGHNQSLLLSTKLKEKKVRLEECLAVNDRVVHQLLATNSKGGQSSLFRDVQFIPSAAAGSTGEYDDLGQLMGNGGLVEGGETKKETDGYDTALQVIHHTARDWTGVVPHVEANDSSVTMIFAAQNVIKMLQQQQYQHQQEGNRQLQSAIYPFLSDLQVNEIDARKRFEMEVFPDEHAVDSYKCYHDLTGTHPNLSFTVGDFVSTYSQQSKQNQYDVVATSFFIDTATNIYEYIYIMKHMLGTNGIWVNCGPVQWHPCALLRPTVEQLKDMLQVAGFELISWSVADEAVAYRHPDDVGGKGLEARYTRSEAYRPLRFVVRLLSSQDDGRSSNDDLPFKIQYSEFLNEVANGKIEVN